MSEDERLVVLAPNTAQSFTVSLWADRKLWIMWSMMLFSVWS